MSKKVETFVGTEMEVIASVSRGYPGKGPSMDNAGGEPAEPPAVEDLYVGVIVYGRAIDITSLLSPKEVSRFETVCLDDAQDEDSD